MLRRRFAAYRAGNPAELAKVATLPKSVPPPPSPRDPGSNEPPEGTSCSDRAIALVERWEDDRNCRLPDEIASVLATLLDVIPDVDQRFLLAAKNRRQMIDRITIVMNQRGGLEAFIAKNRDLVEQTIGPELLDLVAAGRNARASVDSRAAPNVDRTSSAGHGAGGTRADHGVSASSNLQWYTQDLHAYLAAAARTSATYTLDLGGGRTPAVRIRKVIERGTVTMVLGEDIVDDSAIAVPLRSILRVAETPTTDPPNQPAAVPRGPATPTSPTLRVLAGGKPALAGHLPCPCGSGARYRACCRPKN